MKNLHIITHTHWDREWYLPFRKFQLKLVHLIDNLLDILDNDPNYHHFMLDGQTIVLEDYLEFRPEKKQKIVAYVKSGRIGIGPWYVLPDEFLVSPEATIRNLLIGKSICAQFGNRMMVGYIPDPFGHIGQMPQILKGFGIQYASFRRGLADEPAELYWQAPDGSTVLLSYLRDGYDNANNLSDSSPEEFRKGAESLAKSLEPFSQSNHLLLMNGTDHQEPRRSTRGFIREANKIAKDYVFIHSSLSDYFAELSTEIKKSGIELITFKGEARECKRHELLPGVLSARSWIKQANHECETLLEKWVEPFCAWMSVLPKPETSENKKYLSSVQPIIHELWKLLLQCHPHDSICGCSIDEVHREMSSRFEQVKQIGEELTKQGMAQIAELTNTIHPLTKNDAKAILVFNPSPFSQTSLVNFNFLLPAGWSDIQLFDSYGNSVSFETKVSEGENYTNMPMEREQLKGMLELIQDGWVSGMGIQEIGINRNKSTISIEIILSRFDPPNMIIFEKALQEIEKLLTDESVKQYQIHARGPKLISGLFIAKDVTSCGFKTYWVCSTEVQNKPFSRTDNDGETFIQNEFIKVEANLGSDTFTITDIGNHQKYSSLNRFVDGGDAGDTYNYNEPVNDTLMDGVLNKVSRQEDAFSQSLILDYDLLLPKSLSQDGISRSKELTLCQVQSIVKLTHGIPRVDITTKVNNLAKDHRLKVHFPTGIKTEEVDVDSHFDLIQRKAELPEEQEGWMEQPYPEFPQCLFTDVNDGSNGLMIVTKGIYECQAIPMKNGTIEIALTLLRCVGWLSRKNLSRRPRDAGPQIETPDAQQIGESVFEYSVIPYSTDWSSVVNQAYSFNLQMKSVVTSCHEGILPPDVSMVEVIPNTFIISAIKQSEDQKNLVIRGYNPTDEKVEGTIKTWKIPRKVSLAGMDESEQQSIFIGNTGSFGFTAQPHQVLTYLLKY